ncbi:MAG: HAD family hydrolase [Oligoflexia bacterium]|nr:HAD family hydrolase [Oligoflexia bacterium]
MHTRKVFFDAFHPHYTEVSWAHFQEAYSAQDLHLMHTGAAKELTLRAMNELSFKLIFKALALPEKEKHRLLASEVSTLQEQNLQKFIPLLAHLSKHYALGIVSNFCGNLEIILRDAALLPYFQVVIDTYYLGKNKPHLAPFLAAIDKLKVSGSECIFVGDNFDRDILPAQKLSMKTLWYQPEWDHATFETHLINSFTL